jgi:hypothetical protein
MNRFLEKHWFGWGLAAVLALLLTRSIAGGQAGIKPVNSWMEMSPQELQRDNFGSMFPGPVLEPGPHIVWVAVKDNTSAPYSTWRSYGPFDVTPGNKHIVAVGGHHIPAVSWRTWNHRSNNDAAEPATAFYLNQNDSDQIFGVMVVPVCGPVPNTVITGTLTVADLPERRYQCPHHAHPITLDAGKTYVIEMMSPDFGTYLMLEDLAGVLLAQDERPVLADATLNSRLTFRPSATGTYSLLASALSTEGEGNYIITIREVPVMMRMDDRLTPVDEVRNECYVKTYDVAMTAGRRYYVNLESSEFATCMKLLRPDGTIVAFDEGGMDRNTRITFEAPTTGTYQIVATSFGECAVGTFTLTVREEE